MKQTKAALETKIGALEKQLVDANNENARLRGCVQQARDEREKISVEARNKAWEANAALEAANKECREAEQRHRDAQSNLTTLRENLIAYFLLISNPETAKDIEAVKMAQMKLACPALYVPNQQPGF